MTDHSLVVELEDADRPRRPGEPVRGEVVLTVLHDVTMKVLVVEQVWVTHGAGIVDRGVVHREQLRGGSWRAGSVVRFPFSLRAPAGPVSLSGKLVNVEHEVHARFLGFGPVVGTARYVVAASPDAARAYLGSGGDFGVAHADPDAQHRDEVLMWLTVVLVWPMVALPALARLLGKVVGAALPAGRRFGIVDVQVSAPAALAPRGEGHRRPDPVLSWLRRSFVRALEPQQAERPQKTAIPGARVPVALRLTLPPGTTDVLVAVDLVGTEHATGQADDDAPPPTHTHERTRRAAAVIGPDGQHVDANVAAAQYIVGLLRRQGTAPRQPLTLALNGEVHVPDDAAPTFVARHNSLRWQIEVEARIDGVTSRHVVPLLMLPREAAQATAASLGLLSAPSAEAPRCPRCAVALHHAAGMLDEHVCPRCDGRLVGAQGTTRVFEEEHGLSRAALLEALAPARRAHACPLCRRTMSALRVVDVAVDLCPGCGASWFDAGELRRVSAGRHG